MQWDESGTSRPPVGTAAWVQRSGGLLNSRERVSMLAALVRSQARYIAGRLRLATGRGVEPRGFLDVGAVIVPDSSITREAEERCQATLPGFLVEHAYRTFLWASAFARRDSIVHDVEPLYVACLYHDAGLVAAADGRCFTVIGAASATDHARRQGWDAERSVRVGEAITLHLNPEVALAAGPEAHLLHAGASLDVAGIRLCQLDPDTVAAVIAAHPRLGFRREFAHAWREHSRSVPRGRANFLRCYGAFGLAVRLAPFSE